MVNPDVVGYQFLFKVKSTIIGITAIRQVIPGTNSFQKAIPTSSKLKGYRKITANTILHRKLTATNKVTANTVTAIFANINFLYETGMIRLLFNVKGYQKWKYKGYIVPKNSICQ